MLAREREARFDFQKCLSKCRSKNRQRRNFAKHVQGTPSPHLSPHPSHSISQHCSALAGEKQEKQENHRKYIKIVKKCQKSLRKRAKNLADPPQSDQTSPEPDKRLKSYTQSCESLPKVSQRKPRGSPNGPKRLQKGSKKQPERYPETKPEPNPELETPFFSECL